MKKVLTRAQAISKAWEETSAHVAGKAELEFVQKAIEAELGAGAVESPASIARTLADAGVRLNLPEVLQADTRWRESRLFGLFSPAQLNFTTLEDALNSVGAIEDLHRQFQLEGDETGIREVRDLVAELRAEMENDAKHRQNLLAAEIAEWLRIWLQTPLIFSDWLTLRRNSADFVRKFGS
jgi:hypothetical protein